MPWYLQAGFLWALENKDSTKIWAGIGMASSSGTKTARKFIALILQSFLIWGQSWTPSSAGTHANTTHIQWHSMCTKSIKLGQEFQKHLTFPRTSLHWHQDLDYWPVTSKTRVVGRWSTAETCLLPSLGWKFSTTLQDSVPLSETIFNNQTTQQLHKNTLSHKQLAYN